LRPRKDNRPTKFSHALKGFNLGVSFTEVPVPTFREKAISVDHNAPDHRVGPRGELAALGKL